jgi:DNA-binding SARP family transcriptional activator
MSGLLEDAPYERLLALAICELELARTGRLDALASCQEAKQALMASLPAVPPPDARSALERCLAIERQLENELRSAREGVLEALSSLRQAQRAAAGYTPVRRRVRVVSADA